MKHQPLLINIPEPCGEDWGAMPTVGENLRFCAVCSHSLTDFTGMTDREVHRSLKENNGRICGRFRPDQLGRPLLAEPARASRWRGWMTAASILLSGSIAAQLAEPPAYEINTLAPVRAAGVPTKLSGIVTNDDGEGLIGAYVIVTNDEQFYRATVTDLDGNFIIEQVPPNAKIAISFIGYETTTIDLAEKEVPAETHLDVVLANAVYTTEEIVVVGYGITGKRTVGGAVSAIATEYRYELPAPEPVFNYLEQAKVYPNPFTEVLFLDFETEYPGQLTAELTGPNGRLIKRWYEQDFTAGKNHFQLRLREAGTLISGHYFLQLTDGDGRTETRVVIRGGRH